MAPRWLILTLIASAMAPLMPHAARAQSQALAQAPEGLVLDAAAGFVIPVEVNGVVLRLRVDPAASGMVVLNREAARRAKLQPEIEPQHRVFRGVDYREAYARIGSVRLTGRTALTEAIVLGTPTRLRMIWFPRDATPDADGIISVAALPAETVTFRLGAPAAAEAESRLQLHYGRDIGLYLPYELEGVVIAVHFSLKRPFSVATAAAGAQLAAHHGGGWEGEALPAAISFGIERPVRPMRLVQPVELEDLSIGRLLVRTRDHRGDFALPGEAPSDPDEIVVTGTRPGGQPARLNLIVGRDAIEGCSAVRYEARSRTLAFRCARPPAGGLDGG